MHRLNELTGQWPSVLTFRKHCWLIRVVCDIIASIYEMMSTLLHFILRYFIPNENSLWFQLLCEFQTQEFQIWRSPLITIICSNFWRWATRVWAKRAFYINTPTAYSIPSSRPPLALISVKNEWYAQHCCLGFSHARKQNNHVFWFLWKLYNSKGRNYRVHMQLWDTSGQERWTSLFSKLNFSEKLCSNLCHAQVPESHNCFLSRRSWIFVDFRSN